MEILQIWPMIIHSELKLKRQFWRGWLLRRRGILCNSSEDRFVIFQFWKLFLLTLCALNTKYNIQNNKHVKIPCLWFLFLSDPGVLNLGEYFSNSKYSPNYLEIYSIYSPNIFQIYMEKFSRGKYFSNPTYFPYTCKIDSIYSQFSVFHSRCLEYGKNMGNL